MASPNPVPPVGRVARLEHVAVVGESRAVVRDVELVGERTDGDGDVGHGPVFGAVVGLRPTARRAVLHGVPKQVLQ